MKLWYHMGVCDTAQLGSPIILDPKVVGSGITGWLEQEEEAPVKELIQADTPQEKKMEQSKQEMKLGVDTRGQRTRAKPKWLKDFIMAVKS